MARIARLRGLSLPIDGVPVLAPQNDLAGFDRARRRHNLQNGLGGDAFARARLADDANRLMGSDGQVDAINRLQRALGQMKVGSEVAHFEYIADFDRHVAQSVAGG